MANKFNQNYILVINFSSIFLYMHLHFTSSQYSTHNVYPFKTTFCVLIKKVVRVLWLLCRPQIKEEQRLVASNHVGCRGNLKLTHGMPWALWRALWLAWRSQLIAGGNQIGEQNIWSRFKESPPWLSWTRDSVTQPHQERRRALQRAERKKKEGSKGKKRHRKIKNC